MYVTNAMYILIPPVFIRSISLPPQLNSSQPQPLLKLCGWCGNKVEGGKIGDGGVVTIYSSSSPSSMQ